MSALQVDLAVLELLLQKHRLLGGCKLMFNCFFLVLQIGIQLGF